MKILWICPANIGPYHYNMLRSIVQYFPLFTVLRVFGKEKYRPWSSDLGLVPCRILELKPGDVINKLLMREVPELLMISGYNNLEFLRAAGWAKKHKVPCILCSDTFYNIRKRYRWKEKIKSFIVKRYFLRGFVPGERAANYLISLGIPKDLVWRGLYVTDNKHFENFQCRWRLPDEFPTKYFLTVSRLSPEKNLQRLIQAFEIYHFKGGRWGLVIAGTGPEEGKIKQNIPSSLCMSIEFPGWVRYKDLPSLYQTASCFIIPSIVEPWGVVVNEALASGLPVLISHNCGCLPELCHEGVNGYSFDPLNVEQLVELMIMMSSEKVDRDSMGKASKKIISNYTPETWARTVVDITANLFSMKLSHGNTQQN
jgi:glycosyltransferase involved in cell wall biosynthesis